MAHPQEVAVEERAKQGHLSPLMKAKNRSMKGQVVAACPYGCTVEKMDEHGYCKHLVGFTSDCNKYEPMKRVNGKRVVQCKMVPLEGQTSEEGEPLMVPQLEDVRPTDKLVRISVSYRVYRDVDGAGQRQIEAEERKRKDEETEQRQKLLEAIREDPAVKQELLEAITG